ncbi:MAG: PilN domain-containing protein [Gammaproteobacteria bacterium]|nr:PilN domain-containing protein [Gammaproteobacteria bacterium]
MKQSSHSGLGAVHDWISAFLQWWKGELTAMVPAALKPASPGAGEMLLALFQQQRVTLFRRRGVAWSELGSVDPEATAAEVSALLGNEQGRKRTTVARLPEYAILRRQMTLPLAAEKDLRQILAYQLDTLSPYPPEQVDFSHRILRRNHAEKTLDVELCLVPKSELERITERMLGWGVMPDIVDYSGDDTLSEPVVNLLSDPLSRNPPQRLISRANGVLLLVNGLLLAVLLGGQLFIRAEREATLDTRVETMRLQADSTNRVRARLEQLRGERAMLRNMKQERPAVVAVLDELSAILPDNTWLERASYGNDEIKLSGISAKASVLISSIENSELLENAAFQASVVQDDRSGGERFQISAKVSRVAADVQ